jgi:hypothetical protein
MNIGFPPWTSFEKSAVVTQKASLGSRQMYTIRQTLDGHALWEQRKGHVGGDKPWREASC